MTFHFSSLHASLNAKGSLVLSTCHKCRVYILLLHFKGSFSFNLSCTKNSLKKHHLGNFFAIVVISLMSYDYNGFWVSNMLSWLSGGDVDSEEDDKGDASANEGHGVEEVEGKESLTIALSLSMGTWVEPRSNSRLSLVRIISLVASIFLAMGSYTLQSLATKNISKEEIFIIKLPSLFLGNVNVSNALESAKMIDRWLVVGLGLLWCHTPYCFGGTLVH